MMSFAVGALAGALLVKAYPPADALATRLRDWLYGLFRKDEDYPWGGTD